MEKKIAKGYVSAVRTNNINNPFFKYKHVLLLDDTQIVGVVSNKQLPPVEIGDTIELEYIVQGQWNNGIERTIKKV